MAGKTYTFNVIIEPDEDRWFAHCPALEEYGAATWGYTREEALKNIDEVVHLIVDELREDGVAIPAGVTMLIASNSIRRSGVKRICDG